MDYYGVNSFEVDLPFVGKSLRSIGPPGREPPPNPSFQHRSCRRVAVVGRFHRFWGAEMPPGSEVPTRRRKKQVNCLLFLTKKRGLRKNT